nr:unnamed protein product [Digitaria exilis]
MGCFSCCSVDDDEVGKRKKNDDAYVPLPAQVSNHGPSRPPAPTYVTPAGRAQPIAVPAIPLEDMREITKNFSNDALIGEGSYARVYFGVLKDGTKSAVKKLDSSKQPDQDFLLQVSAVSRLKHENVLQLVGFCAEGNIRVLAYEYATRGSLHDILHDVFSFIIFLNNAFHSSLKMAAVAALCVQYEGDFRPNMSIVVKALSPLLNTRTGNRPAGSSASAAALEHSAL